MTSSFAQSPVVEPTTADLNLAYKAEIDSCGYFDDLGPKSRSRPQSFCSSVAIAGTLDVASAATFAVPISVTGSVIVNGVPYMPSVIAGTGGTLGAGGILTANGLPLVIPIPPPLPQETFTDITVTDTATFKNITISGSANLDAGSY